MLAFISKNFQVKRSIVKIYKISGLQGGKPEFWVVGETMDPWMGCWVLRIPGDFGTQ